MSPKPPKPRSGRRQFSGSRGPAGLHGLHGGTNQEWQKVMSSPDVQRALKDPGIGQALYQNLQSSVPGGMGSVVPPPGGPPMQMADGGEADLTPEQAAERSAASRSPAQAAQMQRVGFNPDTASPQRPLRFQEGGLSLDEQEQMLRKARITATPQEQSEIDQKLAKIQQAKMAPQQAPSGSAAPAAPIALPGGGTASSSTMAGLGKLAGQGPATPGNTAAAMGVGALMGLGTTRMQGLSALVGAGTAGLLNYFIRKHGKSAKTPGQTQSTSGADRGQGQTVSTNQEPQLERPAGTGTQPTAPAATTTPSLPNAAPNAPKAPGAPTEVAVPEPWRNGWSSPSSGSTGSAGSTTPGVDLPGTPSGSGIMMGSANSTSGSVISSDGGKTWRDQQTGQPYNDAVINQTQITPGSSLANATPQTTAPPVAPQPVAPQDDLGISSALRSEGASQGMIDRANEGEVMALDEPALLGGSDDEDFARGGRVKRKKKKFAAGGEMPEPRVPAGKPKAVLLRKPPMALPVLHTTIVIAAKPQKKGKKEKQKKQAGGVIRPLKPELLPPTHGPAPHGRVQVPRGSGAAIKGKRFGGIY